MHLILSRQLKDIKIYDKQSKFPEIFDVSGLEHHEFVSCGQSVTSHFYMQVSQRLLDADQRKCQG
jgi:hypothetical protein